MKTKKIIIIIGLFLSTFGYSQSVDSLGYYHTQFQVNGISTKADAKIVITRLREMTGEMLYRFDDSTDTFDLKTKSPVNREEFIEKLRSYGFSITD